MGRAESALLWEGQGAPLHLVEEPAWLCGPKAPDDCHVQSPSGLATVVTKSLLGDCDLGAQER